MREYRDRPNEAPMPDPLAYFLTWATYGTWLPGDERGWVKYKNGFHIPDPIKKVEAEARMTEDACRLDPQQRRLVQQTIDEHCRIRRWELFAVNCRSNHLHVVVGADRHPDVVREQFKAWCTRKLKDLSRQRCVSEGEAARIRHKWWAERGSKRYINDEEGLASAIQYVLDGQDPTH
jgi:hypothetical protein